jgi:hypothetical protein
MNPIRPTAIALAASAILPLAAAEPRPLSTDRPDTTESPITVEAGRFQFESEMAAFTRDGGKWREFALGEVNAKYGLTAASDLQLVLPFYRHVRDGDEGFGDIEVRLKQNLWGNDDGATAMALMPFVKLPTAAGGLGNGEIEGGLIAPFSCDGPAGWSIGLMGEVDLIADEDDGGYHVAGLVSAVAGHALTDTTAAFIEVVGILTTESPDLAEAYLNTGMTLAVGDDWQIDGGIRVGLTGESDDLVPFLGLTCRF